MAMISGKESEETWMDLPDQSMVGEWGVSAPLLSGYEPPMFAVQSDTHEFH